MAESVSGPVVWVKMKYLEPKTRGRYKGGANSAPVRKRKKVGGGPSPIERVKVITAAGKTSWIDRSRERTR